MWEGKWTEELSQLYDQYNAQHPGVEPCLYPDSYAEILYSAMTYEEFVGYIRECLRTGKEIPDVVE